MGYTMHPLIIFVQEANACGHLWSSRAAKCWEGVSSGLCLQQLPVELVHNFTLVHDDIMDNDEIRHGTATVHRFYGMPLAILSGDILFSKAFELLTFNCRKVGIPDKSITDMVARLSFACTEICEGQAIDVEVASSTNFPTVQAVHRHDWQKDCYAL